MKFFNRKPRSAIYNSFDQPKKVRCKKNASLVTHWPQYRERRCNKAAVTKQKTEEQKVSNAYFTSSIFIAIVWSMQSVFPLVSSSLMCIRVNPLMEKKHQIWLIIFITAWWRTSQRLSLQYIFIACLLPFNSTKNSSHVINVINCYEQSSATVDHLN